MAKKGKLVRSASDKQYFKIYPMKFEKNRLNKMKRAFKNQPNNKQLEIALQKAIKSGIQYTRSRKSNGHVCKNCYNSLGFEKNQMNDSMIKSGPKINGVTAPLGQHWYMGISLDKPSSPNHGLSMCQQLEAYGYEKKKYVRKYKKTTR